MKETHEGMHLEDIETLLGEAAKLSNHRNFVIVGSLSSIGALISPPDRMIMSRDVDLYTKMDPDRTFQEIASCLADGSLFHSEHGFYADPVSPRIISAPGGWENRLIPISLRGGIVAWFMDANDAACAKLIRGADNDLEWVDAGLESSALSSVIIGHRLPTCVNTIDDEIEDARKSLKKLSSRSLQKPK